MGELKTSASIITTRHQHPTSPSQRERGTRPEESRMKPLWRLEVEELDWKRSCETTMFPRHEQLEKHIMCTEGKYI